MAAWVGTQVRDFAADPEGMKTGFDPLDLSGQVGNPPDVRVVLVLLEQVSLHAFFFLRKSLPSKNITTIMEAPPYK